MTICHMEKVKNCFVNLTFKFTFIKYIHISSMILDKLFLALTIYCIGADLVRIE